MPAATTDVVTIPVTISFAQMMAEDGTIVLVPAALLNRFSDTEVKLRLRPVASTATRPAGNDWLTVSAAARLHVDDVDGLGFAAAKVKISRAADAGEFTTDGYGRARRIDPVTFSAWRLRQREASLNADDDERDEPRPRRNEFDDDDDDE